MMNTASKYIYLLMLLFSAKLGASDGISDVIIHFEDPPLREASIFCEEEKDIVPKRNDFEILEYALMSSNQGHRYALVTIKNTSSGYRKMKKEHLVAILANCKRVYPMSFELSFEGNEVITKEVNFGLNGFPIIKVINQ